MPRKIPNWSPLPVTASHRSPIMAETTCRTVRITGFWEQKPGWLAHLWGRRSTALWRTARIQQHTSELPKFLSERAMKTVVSTCWSKHVYGQLVPSQFGNRSRNFSVWLTHTQSSYFGALQSKQAKKQKYPFYKKERKKKKSKKIKINKASHVFCNKKKKSLVSVFIVLSAYLPRWL